MGGSRLRFKSAPAFGLGVALLMGLGAKGSQAPVEAPAPKQVTVPGRDRLVRHVGELRQAGKLDEAVAVGEQILEFERGSGDERAAGLAEALSRLAELHELSGTWGRALELRKEALSVRERVDGRDHWRTADARLAVAFTAKVAGLGASERAQVQAALGKEEEAARLEARGKFAESERAGAGAMESYMAALGAECLEAARVWHRIGRARLEQGNATGAKEANQQAVVIRRRLLPLNHPDLGRSLNNLGMAAQQLGEARHAEEAIGEAVRVLRASLSSDDPLIATVLNGLGLMQIALREYAAAKRSHEEALAIRRKALPPDHPDVAFSLNNLGLAQYQLREYAAAKRSHEEALAICRKALPPGNADVATILNNLGNLQYQLREYAAAERSYEEALAIRHKALPPNHPEIAVTLNNLGLVQHQLREYAAAKKSCEEALAHFRKAPQLGHPDVAQSLNSLGDLQLALRDFAAAKQSYEEALAIRRKALPPGHPDFAHGLNSLGNLQTQLRDFAAAKRSYEEALAIRRKALPPDHPDIAQILNNLGHVQYQLREYAAATKSDEEALASFHKALPPDHPDIAVSLVNLGNVQIALRDFATAKRSHEEALAIRRKALPPDHPDIAQSLNNLGYLELELRDFTAAKRSHEEALAIRRKALAAGHPDIGESLLNLALVQAALHEYAAAKRSHEEALAIFRKALPQDRSYIAACLNGQGLVSLVSGIDGLGGARSLTEASDILQAEQFRMAIAQAEPEQLVTAVMARGSLQLLIDATLTARMPLDTAYDRVVRAKGSVTAQQRWARQARDLADPETIKLLDQLRRVSGEIFGLSVERRSTDLGTSREDVAARIRGLSDERARLEQQLSERSGAYSAVQVRARIGGNDVRSALPPGTALIDLFEYLRVGPPARGQEVLSLEPRLVAFVARPETKGVVAVPLGPSTGLADLVDRWRASYGAGELPPAGAPDPGLELRKRLWEPLAEHLSNVKVVLVSPDGPLNGLPWAALPGPKQGTFLVQEYAFATVPVPQLLPELLRGTPRPENQPPSLLLAGDIDFGDASARDPKAQDGKLLPVPVYGPLPGSKSEVNDLRDQFEEAFPAAPKPEPLRKDKATKQAIVVAAPLNRYVHLATHGFFADGSESSANERADLLRGGWPLRPEAAGRHPGLLSGLVFAGVNRHDRRTEETILTALEASELEMGKVDLVVLSACETGRGLIAGGEGVLGLQRAFQLAGARSVVASLWRVPDEETHQLMREFYQRIWSQKPLSKVDALRQAQLWMLENWKGRGGVDRPGGPQGPPPPCVWAAFVLSGDWR